MDYRLDRYLDRPVMISTGTRPDPTALVRPDRFHLWFETPSSKTYFTPNPIGHCSADLFEILNVSSSPNLMILTFFSHR